MHLAERHAQRLARRSEGVGDAIGLAVRIADESLVAELDRPLRRRTGCRDVPTPRPGRAARLARRLELLAALRLDPEPRVCAVGLLRVVTACAPGAEPAP